MMADYLEQKGTRSEAIEFLVMAGKREEAFVMAQSHDLMEAYAEILLKVDEKIPEEHMRIAQFFEGRSKYGMAARHYEHANQARRALDLFLQSGETWYPDAIKMIGRIKQEALTLYLYDYFMGEIDGIPKDPKYIYDLHMVLGKLKEAANAAIIIASEEQETGNYRAAHSRLFETIRDMR